MTIRYISFLSFILAVAPITASQYPKNTTHTFINHGAIVNQGNMTHFGSFYNNGLVVNAPNAHFQTGNVPRQYPQAQYPNPRYGHQQTYPHYQPQYQPAQQLGSFYGDPRKIHNLRQQNPEVTTERPLTPQEKANIEEMEQFAEVKDLLPKKFQGSLQNTSKLAPAEKVIVAEMVLSRMNQDEDIQDLKKVMHVLTGENKEQNLLPASSQQKVNSDHPLFFFNTEDKSLFRETPNTPFEAPKSPKKLFYTRDIKLVTPLAPSVCDQLELKEGQRKAPIHAAAFNKWDIGK